jgi:hypothetical protein
VREYTTPTFPLASVRIVGETAWGEQVLEKYPLEEK